MDLNRIATFVRVVDSGSITKAAAFLHQPKSRVSRNIAALERELGVPLLYRTTRQFSLTDEGRTLYDQCRQQVYELEMAAESLEHRSSEVMGTLKFTAVVDFAYLLLGPVLAEFSAEYPRLTLDLQLSDRVVDLVREGFDLGIRVGELEDAGLKARLLGQFSFILVATPAYLRRAPKLETLADLAQHETLLFTPESPGDRWTLGANGGRRAETVRVKPRCRSDNPKVLLELAIADQGIALVPEYLCVEALRTGKLRHVLPAFATPPTPIHFVWPGQRNPSPKVRAFIDFGLKRLAHYFAGRPGRAAKGGS